MLSSGKYIENDSAFYRISLVVVYASLSADRVGTDTLRWLRLRGLHWTESIQDTRCLRLLSTVRKLLCLWDLGPSFTLLRICCIIVLSNEQTR